MWALGQGPGGQDASRVVGESWETGRHETVLVGVWTMYIHQVRVGGVFYMCAWPWLVVTLEPKWPRYGYKCDI